MRSEAAERANFNDIRYAQVWEDADVLREGLAITPGDVCLSIASAGDNALALLIDDPGRVIALDLSPAQLACLELRVAAFRSLTHPELLELIGSRPSDRRFALYQRCRSALSSEVRTFWDARRNAVDAGIGSAGKFERYFELFRSRVLPLVHTRRTVDALLVPRSSDERHRFYERSWNSWRWRLLFRLFFSRFTMGRLGRDPEFFRYVEGDVAARIQERTRHALVELDPSCNPYVHWILTGTHGTALPCALRQEHFDTIRKNLDRLEWRCQSVEAFLDTATPGSIGSFNLSDLFEYVSVPSYHRMLDAIARAARPGARLVYWNMLAPRRRPESMADRLLPLDDLARQLHGQDRAFFYSAIVVEAVR
jgi:S-adenosylmethionine-diacylglycerol 3-amino-3-carboxypropyl transferase